MCVCVRVGVHAWVLVCMFVCVCVRTGAKSNGGHARDGAVGTESDDDALHASHCQPLPLCFPHRPIWRCVCVCCAACCNRLQQIATRCSTLQHAATCYNRSVVACCSMSQRIAAHRSASQCDAACRSVLQHVSVWCSMMKMPSIREVGGWGRDPKKCTGRGWGMGSSTI